MSFAETKTAERLVSALEKIASEMTATRMAIETLQESVVLLRKEPEEKVTVAPLNDIEDSTEPGFWITSYDPMRNYVSVECSICGDRRCFPYITRLDVPDTVCKNCGHKMKSIANY